MNVKIGDLMEGMTLKDDWGEWYVSMIDESGSVWLDPCREVDYIIAKEIRTDEDLKGFELA